MYPVTLGLCRQSPSRPVRAGRSGPSPLPSSGGRGCAPRGSVGEGAAVLCPQRIEGRVGALQNALDEFYKAKNEFAAKVRDVGRCRGPRGTLPVGQSRDRAPASPALCPGH